MSFRWKYFYQIMSKLCAREILIFGCEGIKIRRNLSRFRSDQHKTLFFDEKSIFFFFCLIITINPIRKSKPRCHILSISKILAVSFSHHAMSIQWSSNIFAIHDYNVLFWYIQTLHIYILSRIWKNSRFVEFSAFDFE